MGQKQEPGAGQNQPTRAVQIRACACSAAALLAEPAVNQPQQKLQQAKPDAPRLQGHDLGERTLLAQQRGIDAALRLWLSTNEPAQPLPQLEQRQDRKRDQYVAQPASNWLQRVPADFARAGQAPEESARHAAGTRLQRRRDLERAVIFDGLRRNLAVQLRLQEQVERGVVADHGHAEAIVGGIRRVRTTRVTRHEAGKRRVIAQ